MTCANEALLQKSKYIERERDSLRDCFTKSVISSQMKGTMGRMVSGLRNRAEQAGLLPALSPPKEGPTTIKKAVACKALEPFFKKPPFEFNECLFPDVVHRDHPLCRAVQPQKPGPKKGTCTNEFVAYRVPSQFLPPLPSRSGGPGNKFYGETYEEDEG